MWLLGNLKLHLCLELYFSWMMLAETNGCFEERGLAWGLISNVSKGYSVQPGIATLRGTSITIQD